MIHPTGSVPERVALIAAGPSKSEWVDIMASDAVEGPRVDEVWGINTVGRALKVDMSFIMDDYTVFRGRNPNFCEWFETAGHPIITSVPRPNCPTALPYPLAEALMLPGAREYFNHSVAYAIAYAVLIGVKELLIFGADYISNANPYRTGQELQPASYMACAAFWTGYAAARGMNVIICPLSPLLDANVPEGRRFYGYIVKPVIRRTLTDAPVEQLERKAS